MNFKKWVKIIKTLGYNGARTVIIMLNVRNGPVILKFNRNTETT